MTDSAFVPKPIFGIVIGEMEFRFFLAWFDLWVGFYIDPKTRGLYACPFPCCVFYIGKRLAP